MNYRHFVKLISATVFILFLVIFYVGLSDTTQLEPDVVDTVDRKVSLRGDTFDSVEEEIKKIELVSFTLVAGASTSAAIKEELPTRDDTLVTYLDNGENEGGFIRLYDVVYVYDGDTIVLSIAGENTPVRLIGIDTPEVDSTYRKEECFGVEASSYVKSLLEDTVVHIELDESQDVYDVYDRLLAYVYLADGTHVNKLLIEGGYAREYTFKVPHAHQQAFREAETLARESGLGMWESGVCGG